MQKVTTVGSVQPLLLQFLLCVIGKKDLLALHSKWTVVVLEDLTKIAHVVSSKSVKNIYVYTADLWDESPIPYHTIPEGGSKKRRIYSIFFSPIKPNLYLQSTSTFGAGLFSL